MLDDLLVLVGVGAALFLFQQFAGIYAVVYYSTAVFRSAEIASDVAASALVSASNVFGTVIASSDGQTRKEKSSNHCWNGRIFLRKGCFNVAAVIVIHMEDPGPLLWHASRRWDCSLRLIIFSWCWSGACSFASGIVCFQDQSKSSGSIAWHALGKLR
ncbi:hypothetical protein F3Y22_tig00110160pilonHSYRG00544 [Hibiscus syriacus]|uniref:Uncharacterized protein n=1 Tax=Hibiscus syriacus TaxID=106335 RepID=A0A6A3BIP1_HIBSY|nr:hypothetical protein F3Y22_tig00110160pilonHSYRG00544 [Hibiscus syriacus]